LKLLPIEIQIVSVENIFSTLGAPGRFGGVGFGLSDAGLLSAVACVTAHVAQILLAVAKSLCRSVLTRSSSSKQKQ